jgi:uncharacterized damage-inducible protein DinB
MQHPLTTEFIAQSIFRIEENTPRIIRCLNELEEGEIWMWPNSASNSVANLVLHLCGNITQYIISSLGGLPDNRNRDEEFSARSGYNRAELIAKLTATLAAATKTIRNADEESLLRIHSVQGFEFSGMGIIIHVTEHYSYHTGQIAFWTKLLKDKSLDFYAGFDLNAKNKI